MGLLSFLVTALAITLVAIFFYIRGRHRFWLERNFPCAPNPNFFFGHVKGQQMTKHACYINQELYRYFKRRGERFGGFSLFPLPAVTIIDPELIKTILVRDFNVFHDRGIYNNPQADPLSGHLFLLEGAPWRVLRQKLSPTFTSGRMKGMFGMIMKVAEDFQQFMVETQQQQSVMEMKEVLVRFTTDVIGTCAFGLECNTLKNPDSEFLKYGRKVLEQDFIDVVKFFFASTFKQLATRLQIKLTDQTVEKFFIDLTRSTVEFREKNNVLRNDFLNLLLQLKQKDGSEDSSEGDAGLTINEMAAQCFVFFVGGFETSSTTMNFCLFELAKNPDVQERLRDEIEKAIEANDGEITYDLVMGIQYLDNVVNETLRLYPPVESLVRVPLNDYTIPGTEHVIPKQTMVVIPVYALHHDADIFPDPERFDPDRFLPDAVKSRHPYAYLPFGEGPRICVGMRFGVMQTKIGLITLLKSFRFSPSAQTPSSIVFDAKMFVLSPSGGNYLNVDKIYITISGYNKILQSTDVNRGRKMVLPVFGLLLLLVTSRGKEINSKGDSSLDIILACFSTPTNTSKKLTRSLSVIFLTNPRKFLQSHCIISNRQLLGRSGCAFRERTMFEWILAIVITLVLATGASCFLFLDKRRNFWKERNFPCTGRSVLMYGDFKDTFRTEHMQATTHRLYREFKARKAPIGGTMLFINKAVIVIDPELIKTILVRDFSNFHDRGIYNNPEADPLSGHMFALEGQAWRQLRTKLSPTFTSGKMKMMFDTILAVADEFDKFLGEKTSGGTVELEMKNILACFTTDVIGTCAFGIECNSLRHPESEIRQISKIILHQSVWQILWTMLLMTFKGVATKFMLKGTPPVLEKFFTDLVRSTVEYREKNNVQRNDFMNLLIQMKNSEKQEEKITLNEISAQVFLFFLAGFDTSSTTMVNCLYELALNPDVQDKLRREIGRVCGDGKLAYETVSSVEYLNMVIDETLRKYPPSDSLLRTSIKSYQIPDSELVLPERTLVLVPIYGIHHDPEYYPEPERFDPERFSAENRTKRHPFVYLPFGEGPRNCIGMRFGLMQTRIGLITILRHYRVRISENTPVPLVIDPKSALPSSIGGIPLQLERV
ncbi:uncharacterized protein LOC131693230 [Topomyia yanbarensis]|uniref:uncharacterized protein LOC131693230 n=1 Tax=Topomyia yanbarensis TaxID=2498891 RepID=UPI00273C5F1C|nr:uncharacterized protein LOC131693230 [Topomyia yanbarensis]